MAATSSPLQEQRRHSSTTAADGSTTSRQRQHQHHQHDGQSSRFLAPASASAATATAASVSVSASAATPSGRPTPITASSASSSFVSVSAARLSTPEPSASPSPSPSPFPAAQSRPLAIDAPSSSRGSSPALQTPSSASASTGANSLQSPTRQDFETPSDGRDYTDNDGSDHDHYHPANMASWAGQPAVRGSSEAARMVLLTFVTVGITFTWGIEMTYCTPYLLDLGLTKSNTSLVWIAGPLSGLIVQPVVGVIADESKSKWGRRRPLMVIGAIIVAASLLILGFTREIIGLFIHDDKAARMPTIVLAVLAIYVVDFAINAVTSCSKSLIVDTLPIEKQQSGAAWASRLSAVGHVIGYGAGAIDLVGIFGTTLGDTQFKQLSVIATVAILSSTAVTCWAVTERVLVTSTPGKHQGRFKIFRQIYSTLLHLPPRIQAICWAQFWAWIGWFPFLFYSTTWIGETYFRYDVPADARKSQDTLGAIGRIGSTSLVMYSMITFAGAWILPLLVQSPEDNSFTHRPPQAIAGLLARFSKVKPTLLTAWMVGHLMFAGAMAMAPFATSFRFATVLVCICGIPWTLAMWAPVAFLGVEVNKLSSSGNEAVYRRISNEQDIELHDLDSSDTPLHLEHGPDADLPPTASTGELSGIYFGILNIYTTLPQFLGTFISTIVFAILEPEKSSGDGVPSDPEGPNPIAVCLFIGAMSTLVAAYMTHKLKVL
ncbi:hypothetical protein AK830_g10940 [Neonectria ditissima]|uniref:General alpha-glucoside permease n=1 Tax=Neonectria ditissima TaxID=78410 RepID=A0A0P7AS83_9HYPO|nr:hypothetical protein AK830_g10940 [Neonectria ditissima]